MDNANIHNSAARRNAVLTQLNPHLKQLLGDNDYKDAPPVLLGENFSSLAKEWIEAAALTKTLQTNKSAEFSQESPPKILKPRGWRTPQRQLQQTEGLATAGKQELSQAPAVKEMTMYKQSCALVL